jgi:hypothetical protein
MGKRRARIPGLLAEHSLSIVSVAILGGWIVLYSHSNAETHLGSFFGNAIADWSGVVMTVIGTKYFYEVGSAESRQPPQGLAGNLGAHLRRHSLSIFLILTGLCWAVLFASLNVQDKWGEVVGNIVSEWTQLLGLVLLTKKLMEQHSKESAGSK